jgi:Fe-S protein assembly co-chaperone HscB
MMKMTTMRCLLQPFHRSLSRTLLCLTLDAAGRRHITTFTTTATKDSEETSCLDCSTATCSFFCPTCNNIKKTISKNCSHFDILGLPTKYDLSNEDIDIAYKKLQKRLHPDLHHQSPDTSSLAASYSTKVNMACDVLTDPVLRGQHLMLVNYGVDPLKEGTPSLEDPELLMFVMEARQEIEDVETENAETLHQHHRKMMNEVVKDLTLQFNNGKSSMDDQLKTLIKLQYVSKMVDEIQHRTPVM